MSVASATNSLSVWSESSRTPLARKVDHSGPESPYVPRHLVILVHGFNVSQAEAEEAYAEFKNGLSPHALRRLGSLWGFKWPGKHRLRGLSKPTYAVREAQATAIGKVLAEFLDSLSPSQSVSLVAHSLGCRVTLEAIAEVRLRIREKRYRGARVRSVVLMAAAVPVGLCRPSADEQDEFPVPVPGSKEHVIFSRRDRVLQLGFGLGELVAWRWDSAVGRDGQPDPRWSSRIETDLGHGDYWESSRVARTVVDLVVGSGLRRPPARLLPSTDLNTNTLPLESRKAPYRLLPARQR